MIIFSCIFLVGVWVIMYFICVDRPHSLWSNCFDGVVKYFVVVWRLLVWWGIISDYCVWVWKYVDIWLRMEPLFDHVNSFYYLYYSHLEWVGRKFEALNSKLTKLILQIGYSTHCLTSRKKSGLIQNPSAQIPKNFHQHGIFQKAKTI